jgi:hypothetical protein
MAEKLTFESDILEYAMHPDQREIAVLDGFIYSERMARGSQCRACGDVKIKIAVVCDSTAAALDNSPS